MMSVWIITIWTIRLSYKNQNRFSFVILNVKAKHHILLAGGSGLIGSHLIKLLLKEGHSVSVLSRRKKNIQDVKCFQWDVEEGYIDINALKNVTTIINLSGQGIADKAWSEQRKKELLVPKD